MGKQCRIIIWSFSWLMPLASHADTCSAVSGLAHIHDAYIALSDEDQQTRADAAIALLALHLPDIDPAELARDLGDTVELDHDRLNRMLGDLLDAAQEVMTDGSALLPPDHVSDTDWLADIVWDSGCHEAWGDDGPARRPPPPPPSALGNTLTLILGATAIVALAGGAIGGVVVLRRTRLFRRRELRKQPRKIVSLKAVAAIGADDKHDVRVLDLSRGGMRIALADAPPQASPLTLFIGENSYPATIAWRNDFYAGILLETPLSEAELQELLALNSNLPDGKAIQGS